jgi:glycine/D-amino acid oxidase-like deaminating enzyme/nitrite reductase/ring-hydroxylating ferredoxin subunit
METISSTSSFWLADEPDTSYPTLTPVSVDVAVIGGGIAGLTTALRLKREGASVAVLEARQVGTGVTGCTSAKVTALQSTMLSTITSRHGSATASIYAAASSAAVEDIASLASELGIDCDLERRAAVTYAAEPDERDTVQQEYEAAKAAGLDVRWEDEDAGLPFSVEGAVWLENQLQFHPVKYVRGLAEAVDGDGSHVFEHSRVLSLDAGSPHTLRTEHGDLQATQIVVATHYPIFDRGLYFARLDAQRSYCIAARTDAPPPRTMAISAGSTTRSLRSIGDHVLVGGEGHSAGASGITAEDRYGPLEEFAAEHWPGAQTIGRWGAQDPVPYDKLPMIGPLLPRTTSLWVATGWQKWGLTGSTFAARILAARVLGKDHEWARTFSPNRVSLKSTPEVAKLGAKFSGHMAVDRVTPAEASSSEDVPQGEARIVRDGLGKKGVYRDDAGALHGVSLRCTHLGCLLRFNGAERSWDCPCHGSRFGVDGDVLEGPAVRPLEQRTP